MFLIHIPSFAYLLLMTFRDVYPLAFDVPISLLSISLTMPVFPIYSTSNIIFM